MFCMKCNNDLSECTCPDLKERLAALGQCDHLYIGKDYKERIEKQANNPEKSETE